MSQKHGALLKPLCFAPTYMYSSFEQPIYMRQSTISFSSENRVNDGLNLAIQIYFLSCFLNIGNLRYD